MESKFLEMLLKDLKEMEKEGSEEIGVSKA